MKANSKRILIFSTAYFPLIGGAEIAVKEITDRIDDCEFVMIAPRLDKNLPKEEKLHNLYIHRIGKGDNWDKFRLIFFGPKYAKQLGKFDIVWSIMASFGGFAGLRYKKQNPQTKFLLTLQEGDSKAYIYRRVWFIWPYFKQIFKYADNIQAISKYLADWARDMGAKCNIYIIPNGVNIYKENQAGNDHYKCNHKKIITVSRLVEKNGVEDLIKAMTYLDSDIHLTILGDGELRIKLEKLSKENNLSNRVHFVGSVKPEDIYNYLVNADVFCRPSLSEGLGNAFLEAMSANLPVIATRVGGIPDFLVEGKTGWFCEVRNPQSIAEKIKYISDEKNQAEVERVKNNAKKMVEEKYNWDLIAKDMNNIFKGLAV